MLLRVWITSFALVLTAQAATSSSRRGVTPEDYLSFEFISDAHLSPDGKRAAYVLTTIDQKRNRRVSSIWEVATDGASAPRRLTADGANAPRWSPDGTRLAFLSSRGGEGESAVRQIFMLRLDGGEGQPLTHLKNGVMSYQWSPDGKRIVAVSRIGP